MQGLPTALLRTRQAQGHTASQCTPTAVQPSALPRLWSEVPSEDWAGQKLSWWTPADLGSLPSLLPPSGLTTPQADVTLLEGTCPSSAAPPPGCLSKKHSGRYTQASAKFTTTQCATKTENQPGMVVHL